MKKKMLLHSCCGPCSTAVIERLKNEFDLTIFYYNPNIFPLKEYSLRLHEQQRYVKDANLKVFVIDGTYEDNSNFYESFKGLENEIEGGKRCTVCFYKRMEKTAKEAKNSGFDIFATTLSVSPHKNAEIINSIGQELSKKFDIPYLVADFKKQDGYLNSIKKSKEYNLYRQDYCGCKFSMKKKS
ncbi:MAG: epoxyqueuosine reductase QueH [Clostridia bacterium]|nr:epoxyqueuosine reductase QueH [Clostridia bacterium]